MVFLVFHVYKGDDLGVVTIPGTPQISGMTTAPICNVRENLGRGMVDYFRRLLAEGIGKNNPHKDPTRNPEFSTRDPARDPEFPTRDPTSDPKVTPLFSIINLASFHLGG